MDIRWKSISMVKSETNLRIQNSLYIDLQFFRALKLTKAKA